MGSTRAARIAGISDAITVTASTIDKTPPTVTASLADTPYSIPDSKRATRPPVKRPATQPSTATRTPRPRNWRYHLRTHRS